jgi:hypothetical protein
MKKSEMKEKSIVDLLNDFYLTAVRTTHEVNSKRGLTKKQAKFEDDMIDVLAERLNFDPAELKAKLNI